MSSLDSLASWLEATRVAHLVGSSTWLTASLSAVHVLGYALVMGGALIANLRLLGLVVASVPAQEAFAPASRAIAGGLAVCIVTGVLLVSSKAVAASGNAIFGAKMFFLLAAALVHFLWERRALHAAPAGDSPGLKLSGAIGLLLWLALGVSAAAYILLE